MADYLHAESRARDIEGSLDVAVRGFSDYVYVGGRPVFVMRGQQTTAGHSYEWSNADCERLVDSFSTSLQTCVPYGLVTDVIGKPILSVDTERRISGVGEYEPYGALNRAAWWGQQTPEPASSGWNVFVNGVPSPHDGMELQVRAHLPWRDVRADTAVLLYDNNYSYLWYAWGRPPQLGSIVNWTPWLTLTTDYFHLVRYAVGTGNGVTPLGVAFDGYEYKRYEAGATPYFPNLRFPGQYYDEETHTHQNWNRVYFPETGSYGQIEPMLQKPSWSTASVLDNLVVSSYLYAGQNPGVMSDPNGREVLGGARYDYSVPCEPGPTGGNTCTQARVRRPTQCEPRGRDSCGRQTYGFDIEADIRTVSVGNPDLSAQVDCVGRSVSEHEQAHVRIVLSSLSHSRLNALFQTEGFGDLGQCNAARVTIRGRIRDRIHQVAALSDLVDLCFQFSGAQP